MNFEGLYPQYELWNGQWDTFHVRQHLWMQATLIIGGRGVSGCDLTEGHFQGRTHGSGRATIQWKLAESQLLTSTF